MVENIILRDLTNGSVLELSRDSTPFFILKEVDWGTINATHNQTRYVRQIGTTLVSSVLGTRDVEISGWVIGRTVREMSQRKRILNNFFNPLHTYQIEYNGYKLEVIFNQSIRYSRDKQWNNEVACEWKAEGISTDPLFYELDKVATESTDADPKFMFPMKFTNNTNEDVVFGEVKLNAVIRIINGGQVDVGMEMHLKSLGEVQNPIITNVETNEFIKINKTLVEGEEILINTSIGNKFIKGKIGTGEYTNYYNYRDFDSSWLQLVMGSNYFVVTAEEHYENLKATFNFNRAYMEVQECE